jgi:D-tyrosyl-tRNA(Tyr) deacylase
VRLVVQRVSSASVEIDGETVGKIGRGILALVAVESSDDAGTSRAAASKLVQLRIFPDEEGKMNRSLVGVEGSVLVVSQFTLVGDVSRGNRPSFTGAAPPEVADPLIRSLVDELKELDVHVEQGRFGANMHVSLVNDGPVTLILDL